MSAIYFGVSALLFSALLGWRVSSTTDGGECSQELQNTSMCGSASSLDDMAGYHHVRPEHDERFNGHLAHYVTMSKITFSNFKTANAALNDIRAGRRTFLEVSKEVSIENARSGNSQPELQNGDLGLITYDLIEEELAEVAFDIRNPIATSSHDILGPVCSPSGCSLMAVFSRYRKSFFSSAWWEANQYCVDHGMKFSELLQNLNTDDMSIVASVIWPHEHVVYKKMKLRQLKADARSLNKIDPSTVLAPPQFAGKKDLAAHEKLMARRGRVFATIPTHVFETHPEIYAMSFEQMMRHGFLSDATLEEVDRTLAEEKSTQESVLAAQYDTKLSGDGKGAARKVVSKAKAVNRDPSSGVSDEL